MITLALAVIMLAGTGQDTAEDRYGASIETITQRDHDPDVVIVALTDADHSVTLNTELNTETSSVDDIAVEPTRGEACSLESRTALSLLELPSAGSHLLPFQVLPRTAHRIADTMEVALAGANARGVDLVAYARRKMLPEFAALYRAVRKRVAMTELPRIQDAAAFTGARIIGTVSTYNPYRDGNGEGGPQTASGEPYDPDAWTAAIKTDLRNQFGGVRYGKLYQPAFALVESDHKQIIVKINDVGPLKLGRVLDLNERSMRHFDPFLTRGLIQDVKITLLPGEDWVPGPVGTAYAVDFTTGARLAAALPGFGSTDSTSWQMDPELARLRMPLAPVSYPPERGNVRAEMRPSEGG